jgi:hypothetical protein
LCDLPGKRSAALNRTRPQNGCCQLNDKTNLKHEIGE